MKKLTALILSLILLLGAGAALADHPFAGMRYYEAGQYWVGIDMDPGEYVLISSSDYGGYFAVSSDSLGRDILFNDVFDVNSIVTVRRGEFLELSRCIAVLATDFYTRYTIKSGQSGVMLKVGYDVMPGTYRLRATTDTSGYYCLYDNSRHEDIIDNDLFENSAYVTLQRGQYVILDRCVLID